MEYRSKFRDRAAGGGRGHSGSRLLAALMVLAPAALGTPAQDTLEVTARIVDTSGEEEEWSPIPGALVWATCSVGSQTVEFEEYEIALGETISDERGEARISLDPLLGLPPIDRADCDIWVTAAHDGYRTSRGLIYLSEVESGTLLEPPTVELFPGRSLVGRVRDAMGAPVQEASIDSEVWDERRKTWRPVPNSYFSDAAGFFRCDCDSIGPVRLSAWHWNLGSAELTVGYEQGVAALTLALELPVIRGRVLRPDGSPIPGCLIQAEPDRVQDGPPYVLASTQADEHGAFTISVSQPGRWKLSVEHDCNLGRLPPCPVTVAAPGDVDVELRCDSTFLLLRTVDEADRLLGSLQPFAHRLSEGDPGSREPGSTWSRAGYAQRVPDGRWLIELEGAGDYLLWIERRLDDDRYAIARDRLEIEQGTLQEATLVVHERPESRPIELALSDADGHPVERWRAKLYDGESGRYLETFGERGIGHAHCLGPSTVSAPVFPPGEYRLEVQRSPEAFTLPVSARITLRPDEPNRYSVRSPGFGGRVRLVAEEAADAELEAKGLRVVFRPAFGGPGRLPEQREYLSARGFDGGPAAVLLEPGAWSWELEKRGGEIVDSGTCEVQEKEETRLVFRVRW